MKPATHTVQQLFEHDVRYIVPLYQRPYVWDEDHQWAPLWEDISALLLHQESEGLANLWSHFLGALVLEQEKTTPGQVPRFTIIDGQQRLTTLQLLLSAAASSLEGVGDGDNSALLRDLIVNNPLKTNGTDRFKVWPTNLNQTAFEKVMAISDIDSAERVINDNQDLICAAFTFFANRTLEYLTGVEGGDIYEDATAISTESSEPETQELSLPRDHQSEEEAPSRGERLRVTLCELVKVVSITLEVDDNAQVIFETLNARGTPLLALDLVKNAVFRKLTNEGISAKVIDDLYYKVWEPELGREHWNSDQRQGRLLRPAGELFLMHWLTMQLQEVVPATELFTTFRERILTADKAAEPLIRELCRDAKLMRSFSSQSLDAPERRFFRRFEALDASTLFPVVLLLFRSPDISQGTRRRALLILESWLARRVLMRLSAKNYNRLAPRLVAQLKEDREHADDRLLSALSSGEGEISRWPSDAELKSFLQTREVYGIVSRARLVMALSAVEESLYSRKVEIPELPRDLSLEHLLPQRWETTWTPLTDVDGNVLQGDELDQAIEARKARIDRLGNLTIVTRELNSSLSNAPWPIKRANLNSATRLLLNGQLLERQHWDPEAIDARGKWLAEQITSIWPEPFRLTTDGRTGSTTMVGQSRRDVNAEW